MTSSELDGVIHEIDNLSASFSRIQRSDSSIESGSVSTSSGGGVLTLRRPTHYGNVGGGAASTSPSSVLSSPSKRPLNLHEAGPNASAKVKTASMFNSIFMSWREEDLMSNEQMSESLFQTFYVDGNDHVIYPAFLNKGLLWKAFKSMKYFLKVTLSLFSSFFPLSLLLLINKFYGDRMLFRKSMCAPQLEMRYLWTQ